MGTSASTEGLPRGVKLLHDPVRNKGTAFTTAEREALGLRGLLPPRVFTQEEQVTRVLEDLRRQPDDLSRYLSLTSLQDRNETLFYRVIGDHLEELLPILYTPTVGQACQLFGHIFRRPRGMFVSAEDRGSIADVLRNWPHRDVRVIVVTDGERILGLGDLGADGMGIPIGKLVIYTACAGVPPTQCLPITLDVGTENEELLADPLYLGLRRRRLRGAEYAAFFAEFAEAVSEVFPRAVLQLEDFATENAFGLLERYRATHCLFDDDIQGTGAVALAGILGALKMRGGDLREERFLFHGAGEASIGIARSIVAELEAQGLSPKAAREHCWFLDRGGLVVAGRVDLPEHKRAFAHEHAPLGDLETAVRTLRPTALLGAAGVPGVFTRPVLRALLECHDRPIVFALSNPTSKSECTAEQALRFTEGRAVFASGSPFPPLELGGRRFEPGQGNNAYVFPGLGAGLIAAQARTVGDEMFRAVSHALVDQLRTEDLAVGRVFPSLERIREVSLHVAAVVWRVAHESGVARVPVPEHGILDVLRAMRFEPVYPNYA